MSTDTTSPIDPVAIAREAFARSFEDHGRPGDAAKIRAGEFISPLADMLLRASIDSARAMQAAITTHGGAAHLALLAVDESAVLIGAGNEAVSKQAMELVRAALKPVALSDSIDLHALAADAKARFDAMTPEQQMAEREAQRQSWVRGEIALGLDDRHAESTIATPAPDRWNEAYRPLKAGEIIQRGDQVLHDRLGWLPDTRCIGQAAPDPSYTSHRMYRRLKEEPTDTPTPKWEWWAGNNPEYFTSGPHGTREEAISAAKADATGEFLDADDGKWKVRFHLCEALNPPLRLSDWAYPEDIIAVADENLANADRAGSDGDEGPWFECTKEQSDDLERVVKAAIDGWQQRHNLVFTCKTFEHMRNEEYIVVDHPQDDGTHRCFICAQPFQPGEMVLPDREEGLGHRACFGEDRQGYCDLETGEPLGPNDPIPAGEPYDPKDYA